MPTCSVYFLQPLLLAATAVEWTTEEKRAKAYSLGPTSYIETNCQARHTLEHRLARRLQGSRKDFNSI